MSLQRAEGLDIRLANSFHFEVEQGKSKTVEMKLDYCVFLWKLSFLKTLEITTPLKSGPYRAHSP
ncbi:uncharacterized protein K444DRAFT_290884 [Hyaloscypha bicolor E]|uniref:Uncharacterized protein n=1 Tax=Hyaloscypha bicolor E TaxID=1095630 RepID=A0A2J6SFM5_9HELO|nr:uncharacterized protein K444DRAFT_290884 [Hyaloscypha bicolor E]PMD49575.1 hypothetical protein K444DRAFT_290884 [Hyaloscypha bicolor E]